MLVGGLNLGIGAYSFSYFFSIVYAPQLVIEFTDSLLIVNLRPILLYWDGLIRWWEDRFLISCHAVLGKLGKDSFKKWFLFFLTLTQYSWLWWQDSSTRSYQSWVKTVLNKFSFWFVFILHFWWVLSNDGSFLGLMDTCQCTGQLVLLNLASLWKVELNFAIRVNLASSIFWCVNVLNY